jgi:hypothetical protein
MVQTSHEPGILLSKPISQHQGPPMKSFMLALLAMLCCASIALCQTETATISGRIADPTGAAISAANVEIQNVATGQIITLKSNTNGLYVAAAIQPGIYRIVVSNPGFKQIVKPDVVLNVQDNASFNFNMEIGSASEVVTVTEGGVNVNSTDASVSTVVDHQFVENLPLNGRSFQSLLYLTPGINANQNVTGPAQTNLGGFVVNGQRGDSNYWLVDGVSANFATTVGANLGPGASGTLPATNVVGGTSALVSVDALQEFRAETSSYAPEFGRVLGGQISIQTRSGTNQFHGTAFDYVRNGDLDATDWFATNQGVAKAIEKQNDFGGVIGGPIIKNKTFFFFSYEGFRLRVPDTFLGTVPDLATRQAAIPAMQPYLNAYPLPKPGVADVSPGLAPYGAAFSNPSTADAYSIRIDHELSSNLKLFGRYNQSPSHATERAAPGNTSNTVEIVHESTKTVTVGATFAKSAGLVNDVRFNYSTNGGNARFFQDNFDGGSSFPAESLFPSPFSYKNAWIAFVPLFGTNMRFNAGFTDPKNSQTQYNVVDTVALQKGSHSLKFGVDYRHMSPTYGFAQYLLLPFFSSVSDLENGTTPFSGVINSPRTTVIIHNLGAYAQDTWRVNSRLNLTYGLRWDVDFKPSTDGGPNFPGLTGFSTTDLSNLALAPAGAAPYSTRYGNVAPRIGGAYQISQNPEWGLVLRGGFGVLYGMVNSEVGDAIGSYPLGSFAFFSNVPFPTPPDVAALPPIAAPNPQNGFTLFGFDPHLNAPYALEWNVALEQSLGRAQSFSLSYVGAADRRLLATESITNPNLNYSAAELIANRGELSYNALQAQFRRALTRGLQALVSYNWSHSIDTGSFGLYANGNFADVNANRGDSDYDVRHSFSAALTYEIPSLKGNPIARAITSGWSTNNIVQIHSGPPIDITDSNFAGALSQLNASVLVRPDVVPGQPLYLHGSQYPGGEALNPAAFIDPPVDPVTGLPTRQGNLGRNSLHALGLTEWDFAVHRDFPLHESVKLQFSAELFNVLNHPNFGLFNSTFQTGNTFFGQSTTMQNQLGGQEGWGIQSSLYASGGPRSTQLALKLVF